jgi:hypothetical protein
MTLQRSAGVDRRVTALKRRTFPQKRVSRVIICIIDNIARTATFSFLIFAKTEQIRGFGCGE